jgi:hypothetical protein
MKTMDVKDFVRVLSDAVNYSDAALRGQAGDIGFAITEFTIDMPVYLLMQEPRQASGVTEGAAEPRLPGLQVGLPEHVPAALATSPKDGAEGLSRVRMTIRPALRVEKEGLES